jgi:polysaccharide export outer membrane protein
VRKLLYLFIIITTVACNKVLNPSLMFKTPEGYKYSTARDTVVPEYRLSSNDRFTFNLSTNDGYKLLDYGIQLNAGTSGNGTGGVGTGATAIEYLVDKDGYAKLPTLGKVYLRGMTVSEVEKMLEDKYSVYYRSPFIILKVTNKRVLVFPGEGGAGIELILINDNTSLLEALAMAGGIRPTGKAFRVKLIRGGLTNSQIFLIDFSTVDAMKSGDIVLQANDIIYVEPIRNTSNGILAQISPVVSILSAILLVYEISKHP